jgi:hypothetical protein
MMTQFTGLTQPLLKTKSLLKQTMAKLLFQRIAVGSTIVYASDSKVSIDVPVTLTNLVSFFQGMRLCYNDGQGTQDIVTFLGADFIDDMQLKCKIT